MSTKLFQRTTEDFTCEHCGTKVIGDGYTNHCPACLWSRHVDENPGDRVGSCAGLMPPVGVEVTRSGFTLLHRCERCGLTRRNRTAPNDDREALAAVARQAAERAGTP